MQSASGGSPQDRAASLSSPVGTPAGRRCLSVTALPVCDRTSSPMKALAPCDGNGALSVTYSHTLIERAPRLAKPVDYSVGFLPTPAIA